VRALNPEVTVSTLNARLEGDALREAVRAADVVIDASDNFATRFAINHACMAEQTPLVSGAAIRMEGQVSVFPFTDDQQPCYHCLYTDDAEDTTTCSDTGVLAPVVGIIGCIQATETIKLLANMGAPLVGRLLILDASTMEFREMRLRRDPQCPTCGNPATHQTASS
jgi:molybdopterin/thiamine biosynthesis adenylyltransferase